MERDANLPEDPGARSAAEGSPTRSVPVVPPPGEAESGPPGQARAPRLWPWVVLAVAGVSGLIAAFTDVNLWAAVAAVLLAALIMRVGWFFLAQFATPPPPPPDPGTLRRVRLTYRCPVCSAEVRMTSAASEDPEPPRHCMEEMELVASEE